MSLLRASPLSSRWVWTPRILACSSFLAVAVILLPYNGIEIDESLFAGPLYRPIPHQYRIRIFHHDIPLMVMDFIGALKSWLYWPIFHFWKPAPASLRFPAIVIGVITIWLFASLLEKAAGKRAAALGALLLATDPMFLMTTEFDWGPVAIQHLMWVAGCLAILAFARSSSPKALAAGFLALGLGLWDKATFGWILGGLTAAALAVFPREVLRRFTGRNLAIAAAGFLLGSWPLLVFNVMHGGQTFRHNASFSTDNLAGKVAILRATLTGAGLFGYMVNEPAATPIRNPSTALERVSTHLADLAGERREQYLTEALVASVLFALLVLRRMRVIWFALLAMTIAWIGMALTRNAGGGVHHTVLLWPFPQFIVAVVLAGASERWVKGGAAVLAVVAVLLCGANLLTINQYLSQLIRNGPSVTWTKAVFPLSDSLLDGEAGDVYVMDWGIFDTLVMLHRGRLHVSAADLIMQENPTAVNDRSIDTMLMDPRALFVGHTPGNEVFPGTSGRLDRIAAARGHRKQVLQIVRDYNGRPVFVVYRFHRQGQ